MKRRLFSIAGLPAVLLAFGLVASASLALAGCDALTKGVTKCANNGECMYASGSSYNKNCGQSDCDAYKAANRGSAGTASCSCSK
jgi:hypothetical protein